MALSIGLLSWRAHETLRKTLKSYRRANLFACADDFKIFFNEISDEDRAIAAEFGVEAVATNAISASGPAWTPARRH